MRTWRCLIAVAMTACGDHWSPELPPVDAPPTAEQVDAAVPGRAPAVIVMIGDGMGGGQLEAASLYRHGEPGRLAMQQLARRAELRTGGLSGITDSAAAATVMATGRYTWNGRLGVDRHGEPVETVLERARDRGWATGVVTTTSLPHATPAGYTVHNERRGDYAGIAREQIRQTRPTVMLGGGSAHFGDDDVAELAASGYHVVDDRESLHAAVAAGAPRLFGAFVPDQMTYVLDRRSATTEPELGELARAALETLDRDADGFFLLIEGGRIDHGSHGNDLPRTIAETLAFDDTIALVAAWARRRGNVTLLVTADHECGGLEVVEPRGAGVYPGVRWRWGAHTNARVALFAEGPGTEALTGAVVDHRWIHELARARIDRTPFVAPGREPVPDGELGELRHRAVTQQVVSGYDPGRARLDALWLDATADGLFIGIEGLFAWDEHAVEVWIDVDPGARTGPAGLAGALADQSGTTDRLLTASSVTAPAAAAALGFGVDLALVVLGGADLHVEDLSDRAGLRGVRAPFGAPHDLGWRKAAVNFGAVRTRTAPLAPVAGQGLEVLLPWSELYPGGIPAGARVALAAVLVSTDGGHTSNQALPPFPPATPNPGRARIPLPGVVLYTLDADGDGTIDGAAPPTVIR